MAMDLFLETPIEHTYEPLAALLHGDPERWLPGAERMGEQLIFDVGLGPRGRRVQRKVRGALHEETLYGPTDKPWRKRDGERPWAKGWVEQPGQFAYRKPLEALTLAEVEHIRDARVRELVIARLERHGIKAGRKKRGEGEAGGGETPSGRGIPKEVWKEPLLLTPREGRGGRPAVIKKVRLVKKEGTIQPIRSGRAYVKPGSLHHLCLFEYRDERGRTRREAVFVSMLEAARRKKDGEPIIRRVHPARPDARFIMSLSRGEMVLLRHNGREALYCFVTAASTSEQMWFRHHTAAGKASDKRGVVSKSPGTLDARKVTVDVLGRIRWAND